MKVKFSCLDKEHISVFSSCASHPHRGFLLTILARKLKFASQSQDSLTRTYGAPNRSIFLLYFYGPVYFYMVISSFYVVNFLLFISIKSYIEEM